MTFVVVYIGKIDVKNALWMERTAPFSGSIDRIVVDVRRFSPIPRLGPVRRLFPRGKNEGCPAGQPSYVFLGYAISALQAFTSVSFSAAEAAASFAFVLT